MRKKLHSMLEVRSMAENQVGDVGNALPHPVGQVRVLPEVNEYVQTLIAEWNKIRGNVSSWTFWKSATTAGFHKATQFLLQSIDGLVLLVDDLIDLGADKKATVLNALDKLYDYVVREAIPIWLRPFAGVIKNYVVYTVASSMIDWIVAKYNNGSWK